MSELGGYGQLKDVEIEAVVHRAVPCDRHASYTPGCPDCLTGEQAAQRQVPHVQEDLGVVSAMSWGRLSVDRLRAVARIRKANRRAHGDSRS